MIAPGLVRQGSFVKERRSDSYARLSKAFMAGKEQARASEFMNQSG
jgi:hypothetical protein